MRAYRAALGRLGHLRAVGWLGVHVVTPVDKWLFARVHGRIVSTGPRVLPGLMLTTTGRRSGRPRSTPLLYLEDGHDLVVVASNWGQRRHPAWSDNLLADPRAVVDLGARRWPVAARLANEDERERLWPCLLRIWPAYRTYARRSGRDLRVFVLSPREGTSAHPSPP